MAHLNPYNASDLAQGSDLQFINNTTQKKSKDKTRQAAHQKTDEKHCQSTNFWEV